MYALFPCLLSIWLVCISQVAAQCSSNQCESKLNSSLCIDLLGSETMDCVTYICRYDSASGRNKLIKDEDQENRCHIHNRCYKAGEGPNVCTVCEKYDDGTVGVVAGCESKPHGVCVPDGASFQDGCYIKMCAVANSLVTMQRVGTVGCEQSGQCYEQGDMQYRYTCKKCVRNKDSGWHEWHNECRDLRNNQCFARNETMSIRCNTFICSNRGGIGWHHHQADNCEVAENDCVPKGSTSLRNGFCYYCDDPSKGAGVGCSLCGQCVREGESVSCNGEKKTCGNVDDLPTERVTVCTLPDDSQTYNVGEMIKYNCNWYECTPFGPRQITSYCFFNGECRRLGDLVDENNCIRCTHAGLQKGCKYNGICIDQGGTIRINCVKQECTMFHGNLKLVRVDNQETTCQCGKKCYPLGRFDYHGLCGICHPDRSIEYACKLDNGECLGVNEVEALPSRGCYKMKCIRRNNRLGLVKAQGQPLRCYLPDGRCIDENESVVINGTKYICLNGETCLYNGKKVPVGEARMVGRCSERVCTEGLLGSSKVFRMVLSKTGCEYGDEECKSVNETYDEDCNTVQCVQKSIKETAIEEVVTKRCEFDGHCFEKGSSHRSASDCALRKCENDLTVKVLEEGCKIQGTCLAIGQTEKVNGQDEECKANETTKVKTETRIVTGCAIGDEAIALGETKKVGCNSFTCVQTGSYKPYVVFAGPKKCGLLYDKTRLVCFDLNTTRDCYKCFYEVKDNRWRLYSKQVDCRFPKGKCVPPGEQGPYRCGEATCDPVTLKPIDLKREKCSYHITKEKEICIGKGQYYPIQQYSCTCGEIRNDKGDKLKCFKKS